MKTLTRLILLIPILFIQFFMAYGVFAAPVVAKQSRPDLVLRIHGLTRTLKVVDDIAGAGGSKMSPSVLLGGMLQGTAWIDSSKDIVLGAWFDPARPDAPPVMGAIVPFANENAGFASAYHASAGKGYYLISLPPGNPKPLATAFESALAGESKNASGRFFSMEISLSQILKNADSRAVRAFKKALKLDPEAVEAEFKLGVSYGALREYDRALKHMNTALSKSPENSRYRYGRAWIYLLSGQRDKAMTDMKAAAQEGNPDARRYLKRAQ